MRVEARYCDKCGVMIALDELESGDAIQLEESVFHCKDCKEKLARAASAAKEKRASMEKEAEKAPGKEKVSASRRLIARRLASGRLAKSKPKIPAALTSSSDGEKDEAVDKKRAADRGKARERIEKKKKAKATKESEAPLDELEIVESEGKVEAEAEAPKKKLKKSKKGAPSDEKSAKDEKPKKAPSDEKSAKDEKPKKSPSKLEKVEKDKPEAEPPASEDDAKAKPLPSKKVKVAEAKKDEPASGATGPKVSKAEPASSEPASSEPVSSEPAASEPSEPEKATLADAGTAPILKTDSPPSALSESPAPDDGSDSAIEKIKAEEQDEPEAEGKPSKKKKKAADDDEAISTAKTVAANRNILTPSDKKRAEKGDKDKAEDADDTGKEKKKKRSGGGTALAEKEPSKKDSKSKGKALSSAKQRALAGDSKTDDSKKKKGLPIVPIAVGVVVLGLGGGLAAIFGGGGGGPKLPPFDKTALVDEVKKFASEHPDDREDLRARWEGLREVSEGEPQAKTAQDEIDALDQRFQSQARSAFDDVDGKVTRALSASPREYDAALAALAGFPGKYRSTSDWQRRGPQLELEVVRRRAAFVQGLALLKAAKESWESEHNADVLSGLFAVYPPEYRETEEGKAILEQFNALRNAAVGSEIDKAGAAASAANAAREEAKWKKVLADRSTIEASNPNAKEQKQLGNDRFEWQVRDFDHNTGEPLKDAYKVENGKLVINNTGSEPIIFGKNKRDWANFTIEFKIKVKKGTKVWFVGRINGNERAGFNYDKLNLCNTAGDSDQKPHMFQGVPEDTWCTVKFRCLGTGKDAWDVCVDGKEFFQARIQGTSNNAGGFGFLVGRGQIEVDGIKAKVIGTTSSVGSDDEE